MESMVRRYPLIVPFMFIIILQLLSSVFVSMYSIYLHNWPYSSCLLCNTWSRFTCLLSFDTPISFIFIFAWSALGGGGTCLRGAFKGGIWLWDLTSLKSNTGTLWSGCGFFSWLRTASIDFRCSLGILRRFERNGFFTWYGCCDHEFRFFFLWFRDHRCNGTSSLYRSCFELFVCRALLQNSFQDHWEIMWRINRFCPNSYRHYLYAFHILVLKMSE